MENPRILPHVVFLPLPVQGHIKPFLMLGKLLSHDAGIQVTFVNTHHNQDRFQRFNDIAEFYARFPNFLFMSVSDGLPSDHPRSGRVSVELQWKADAMSCPYPVGQDVSLLGIHDEARGLARDGRIRVERTRLAEVDRDDIAHHLFNRLLPLGRVVECARNVRRRQLLQAALEAVDGRCVHGVYVWTAPYGVRAVATMPVCLGLDLFHRPLV